jgi:hypothetical protein
VFHFYLLLPELSLDEELPDDDAFDPFPDEEPLPPETEVPDPEEDDLLAGVLTDRDGEELLPPETEVPEPAEDDLLDGALIDFDGDELLTGALTDFD